MTGADPRLALFASTVDTAAADALALRFDETEIRIDSDDRHALLALSLGNLTARLWPNTTISGPDVEVPPSVLGTGHLGVSARSLVGAVRLSSPAAPRRVLRVALGARPGPADVFASADKWTMRIGSSPVEALDGTRGPATIAAAALIAAELFRHTIPELPGVRLTGLFEWNLVDYRAATTRVDLPRARVDVTCFGAGSVGSSLVLALLVAGVPGHLHLVDDDVLQARNRLRYPLWIAPASGAKVEWAANLSRGSGLTIEPHLATAAAYGAELASTPLLAVAAVDTPRGRAEVADVLACETLNAGVDGLSLHVSRHRFADGLACVYCQYVNVDEPTSDVGMYVDLTGLTADRVTQLLTGDRLSEADLTVIVNGGRLEPDEAADLVGGRLVDVARARLYAGASVPALGAVAVVAPWVSALAGAVLAAEVVKGPRSEHALDRRVDLDLSGRPTGLTSRRPQDPTHRCLCWASHRVRAYESVWSDSP